MGNPLPRNSIVTFPDSLVSLVRTEGSGTGVSLLGMYNYSQLKHIGSNFFERTRFTYTPDIKLPNIETLASFAFNMSYINSLDLRGAPMKVMSSYICDICRQLSEVYLNEGLEVVGYGAFAACNRDSGKDFKVAFPSTLKTLGALAFGGIHRFTEFKLNEGLETIGYLAFGANDNSPTYVSPKIRYTKVTIPSTVIDIGYMAFGGNIDKLSDPITMIMLPNTPPLLRGLLTQGGDIDIPDFVDTIYVPLASIDAYKTASNWSRYVPFGKIKPFTDHPDWSEEEGKIIE